MMFTHSKDGQWSHALRYFGIHFQHKDTSIYKLYKYHISTFTIMVLMYLADAFKGTLFPADVTRFVIGELLRTYE